MAIRIRSSHISTSVSISLVLFLMGITALLLLNASHFSDGLRKNIHLSVILNPNLSQADVLMFRKELDLKPFVTATRFVSKEEAAERLQSELGENFIELLGVNPLPNTVELSLGEDFLEQDSLLSIQKSLSVNPLVKGVYYPKTIASNIDTNIRRVGFLLMFFALLLMVITIGLINNWVRISIYSDRFLIRTQELVGATPYFISKPYIGAAIAQGIAGSIFATALLTIFVWLVQAKTDDLLTVQYLLAIYVLLFVVGSVFGGVAAYFAVKKYLNVKLDNLYL
jgi:cell division transport system permease protein